MAPIAIYLFCQPLSEEHEKARYSWFTCGGESGISIGLRNYSGIPLLKSPSPRLSSLFHSVKSVRAFDPQLSIMMERLRTMQFVLRSGDWSNLHNDTHRIARYLLSSRAAASHPRFDKFLNVLQSYPCRDTDDGAIHKTSQSRRRLRHFVLASTPRSHPLALTEALFFVRYKYRTPKRNKSMSDGYREILIRLLLFLRSDLSSFSLALSCARELVVTSMHEQSGYFPLRPVEALSIFVQVISGDSTFLRKLNMEELRGIQGDIDHTIRAMESVSLMKEQGTHWSTVQSYKELICSVMDRKGGKSVWATQELLEMILLTVGVYTLLRGRGVSRLWRDTIDSTAPLRRRLFLDEPISSEESLSTPFDSGSLHPIPSLLVRLSSTPFDDNFRNDTKRVVIPRCLLRQPVHEKAMCRRMFFIYPPVKEFVLEIRGRPPTVLKNPAGIRFSEVLDRVRSFSLKQSELYLVHKDTGSRYDNKENLSRKRTRIEQAFADMVLPEDLRGTHESARGSWNIDMHVGFTKRTNFTPEDYPFSGDTSKHSRTYPLIKPPHHSWDNPFDLSWMGTRRAGSSMRMSWQ